MQYVQRTEIGNEGIVTTDGCRRSWDTKNGTWKSSNGRVKGVGKGIIGTNITKSDKGRGWVSSTTIKSEKSDIRA